MKKTHLLLVEDDADLGRLLSKYLGLQGLEVALAIDGQAALAILAENHFDVAILDIMLPREDGFSLAKTIKKRYPDLPFLFLTARGQKQDVINGLQLGADDYMVKPFDADELILRIQNIIRRSTSQAQTEQVLNIGAFLFEPSQLRLSFHSHSILLTKKEAGVLEILAKHPDRLVSRQEILEQLWEAADYFSGRSLDVYVGRLRKLLEQDKTIHLESVRGTGFILHTAN